MKYNLFMVRIVCTVVVGWGGVVVEALPSKQNMSDYENYIITDC